MFLITVASVDGKILTFKIETYSIEDGFVVFIDKYGLEKKFPIKNCQIEEQKVME